MNFPDNASTKSKAWFCMYVISEHYFTEPIKRNQIT